MAFPTVVLDTNALSARGLWTWLARYPGRKILPIVAFVEAGVYFGARMGLDRFRQMLDQAKVEVEWMRIAEASRAVQTAILAQDFEENARDHLIAGHVGPGRVLVTSNVGDFAYLEKVWTPEQAMRRSA